MGVLVFAFFFLLSSPSSFPLERGAQSLVYKKKNTKTSDRLFPRKRKKAKETPVLFSTVRGGGVSKENIFFVVVFGEKKKQIFCVFFLVFVERRKDFFKNHRAQKSADGGFL